MPRRDPNSYLVVAARVPYGGHISWVCRATTPEEAIEAAHQTQAQNGAYGMTLLPYAVFDRDDCLVWGDYRGIPASFLPRSVRPVRHFPHRP